MSEAARYVGRVRRLFPTRAEDVSRLALRNEAFRMMCEEYGVAIDALEVLEARNYPGDVEKMHEYRVLIRELEQELSTELLSASSSGQPR